MEDHSFRSFMQAYSGIPSSGDREGSCSPAVMANPSMTCPLSPSSPLSLCEAFCCHPFPFLHDFLLCMLSEFWVAAAAQEGKFSSSSCAADRCSTCNPRIHTTALPPALQSTEGEGAGQQANARMQLIHSTFDLPACIDCRSIILSAHLQQPLFWLMIFRGGSSWMLRKTSSEEEWWCGGTALQGGGGVTIPGSVQ